MRPCRFLTRRRWRRDHFRGGCWFRDHWRDRRCGFSRGGLPIGLQLQAPPFEEERLLRGAAMFQHATDWHTKTPALA